jgi:SPP1 family predicted phage head-tail adaptor
VRAGKLKRRLTLQRRVESKNAYGETVWTWADVDTIWGGDLPLTGRELFAAQQVQAQTTEKIEIRYRADVQPKMRFYEAVLDKYYGIDAILPSERRNYVIVMCTVRDADGWRDDGP